VKEERNEEGRRIPPLEVPAQQSDRQLAACPNEQTPDPTAGATMVFPARLGEVMACEALICRRGNSLSNRETTNGHYLPINDFHRARTSGQINSRGTWISPLSNQTAFPLLTRSPTAFHAFGCRQNVGATADTGFPPDTGFPRARLICGQASTLISALSPGGRTKADSFTSVRIRGGWVANHVFR